MTKRGAAFTAAGIFAAALVLLAIAVIVDRRVTPPAQASGIGRNSFEQQLATLDLTYKRGQVARKALLGHQLAATQARCSSLFQASRASELNNRELVAEAERFFLAGCMAYRKPR